MLSKMLPTPTMSGCNFLTMVADQVSVPHESIFVHHQQQLWLQVGRWPRWSHRLLALQNMAVDDKLNSRSRTLGTPKSVQCLATVAANLGLQSSVQWRITFCHCSLSIELTKPQANDANLISGMTSREAQNMLNCRDPGLFTSQVCKEIKEY